MMKITGQEFLTIKKDELSSESKNIYNNIIDRDFGKNALTQMDINKIKMVIEENFKIKNGDLLDPDYQMQSESLTYILNKIIIQRNNIINNKKNELKIQIQLETLKKSCETLIDEYKKLEEMYNHKGIRLPKQLLSQYKVISKKATEIVNILDSDMKYFKQFVEKYNKVKQDFELIKSRYERKNIFSKILAKFNGQEKEYNNSKKQITEYEKVDNKPSNINVIMQDDYEYQFELVKNPCKYQEMISDLN